MNILQIIIISFLAISLIFSYILCLRTEKKYDNYFNHPLWFGINKKIIMVFTVFQMFALIGFITYILSLIFDRKNINDDKVFYGLLLFFISSILWSISMYFDVILMSVISLVLTALSSIWLLSCAVEEDNIYRIIGMLFVCIVTVLIDGIIWNTNYILKKNKEKI